MIKWTNMALLVWMTLPLGALNGATDDTGIGNGGEVLSKYLAATRAGLVKTLQFIHSHQDPTKVLQKACASQADLDQPQQAECVAFISATGEEMLLLNVHQTRKVPFTLSAEPLFAENENGGRRRVAALTQLGNDGDIQFDYEAVELFSPAQLLALMGHEFGHKSKYREGYLRDFEGTEAFVHGYQLLDSVGQALATIAKEQGFVSSQFSLQDRFYCETVFADGRGTASSGTSKRMYAQAKSYNEYETSIGRLPSDMTLIVHEAGSQTTIHLEVVIHETAGCQKEAAASERWTALKLMRKHQMDVNGNPAEPDEELKSELLSQFNPICLDKEDRRPMEIAAENLTFRCMYEGAEAISN